MRVSKRSKERQGRGRYRPERKVYWKPWNRVRENKGCGMAEVISNWRDGRKVETMSQGERDAFMMLNFDDQWRHVLEQVPLRDVERVRNCAKALGLPHVGTGADYMTTDLVTVGWDDHIEAWSIKYDSSILDPAECDDTTERDRLEVERAYWETLGVPFHLWFRDRMNETYAKNIADVTDFWRLPKDFDLYELAKHLAAWKVIDVGLEGDVDWEAVVSWLASIGDKGRDLLLSGELPLPVKAPGLPNKAA